MKKTLLLLLFYIIAFTFTVECNINNKIIADFCSNNNICLNTKNCIKNIGYGGRWSIQIKPNKCKCNGKFGHKCDENYCALNKSTCDCFKTKSINNNKIKECIY
jgi:hypothetical protein